MYFCCPVGSVYKSLSRQGASNKHTKSHTHMQRLMHKHRYTHRGQLWANNSGEMKSCTVARVCRCISTQNPENTGLGSDSNAEHCNWPDNRWAAQAETHRNVFFTCLSFESYSKFYSCYLKISCIIEFYNGLVCLLSTLWSYSYMKSCRESPEV